MPEFLIAYHGGNPPATQEEGKQHFAKYKTWLSELGDAAVVAAQPLGPAKRVSAQDVVDDADPAAMNGYTIVRADDLDAAIAIAQRCPFLDVGGTLRVAQLMSMPV